MSRLYRELWNAKLESLCVDYEDWCKDQGLPHVDAYEQLQGPVTEDQRAWLEGFCERWDEIYDQ